MPRSETAGRLAIQLAEALDGVRPFSAERGDGVGEQRDLSAPKTWQWLARICSMSVVPERGSPTTNTGSSLSNPKPRTRWKKSGVQTVVIRVT